MSWILGATNSCSFFTWESIFFKGTERWFCPSSVPVTSGVSILIFSLDSFWGTSPSGSEIYFIFQNLAGQQHIVNLSTRVPFSFGNLKMESSERNEYIEMMENNSLGRPFTVHLCTFNHHGEHCSMIMSQGVELLLKTCCFNPAILTDVRSVCYCFCRLRAMVLQRPQWHPSMSSGWRM